MTQFSTPLGDLSSGVINVLPTGVSSSLSPSGSLQLLGNDGSGNVAVSTLTAGSGIAVNQTGANMVVSATGSPSYWVASPGEFVSSATYSYNNPASTSSLNDALDYGSAVSQIFPVVTQNLSYSASWIPSSMATFFFQFQSNLRLLSTANGFPLTLMFLVYQSPTPSGPFGTPMYTFPYIIPSQNSLGGGGIRCVRFSAPIFASASTSYVNVFPIYFIVAGSYPTTPSLSFNTPNTTNFFINQSAPYGRIVPTSTELLDTPTVSLTSAGATAIVEGAVSMSSTLLFYGDFISFGEPAYTTLSIDVPLYITGWGVNSLTEAITVYIAIYIGPTLYRTYETQYWVPYTVPTQTYTYFFDNFQIETALDKISDGQAISIYASWQPYNAGNPGAVYVSDAGLPSSIAPAGCAYYTSKVAQFSTATGNTGTVSKQTYMGNITNPTVALPLTVNTLSYDPTTPSSSTLMPLTSANLVDTTQLEFNSQQLSFEIQFNFAYKGSIRSNVGTGTTDLPIIMVVLALTDSTGTVIYQPFAKAHKAIPNFSPNNSAPYIIVDTIPCMGRVNVLSGPMYVSAYAFICANTTAGYVQADPFMTFNTSSGYSFPGHGSVWTITQQSLIASGGSSGAGVTVVSPASGSYLTSSTTNGAVSIGTTTATTSQAGLLAAASAGTLGQYATLGATGVLWSALPSYIANIVAQAGSYLTATTASGATTISTSLATTSQAGLLAASAAGTSGQYATLGASGVTWTTLPTSIASVAAQAGSYLTATTTSGATTLSTTQASSSQAGLLSVASSLPANTVLRVNNSGQLVAATTPYFAPFGTAVWLNLGGAHVAQVQGTQSGTALYVTGVAIPAAATGAAQSLYAVDVNISLNITTVGTSTGALTVVGMPVTPFLTATSVPEYITLSNDLGFALPNNVVLQAGYTSGSTTLTLYQYNIDTQVRTACTNANTALTAPVQFRFKAIVLTLTAPTN